MLVTDDTDLPVAQSRFDRGSGRRVDKMIFGSVFIFGWSVGTIETGSISVSLLLADMVLKISETEVLILLTPEEAETGVDAVVSEGPSVLLVLASVFSAKAKKEGMARLVPIRGGGHRASVSA